MEKYQAYMVFEGNQPEFQFPLFCCGCSKPLEGPQTIYCDVDSPGEMFCSKNCIDRPILADLAEVQIRRFARLAAEILGLIEHCDRNRKHF